MSSNTKYVLQIVLSVLTFGLVWVVDNQAAVITALAIVIVWLLNMLSQRLGIKVGRRVLTTGLYVVSFVLVIIINPIVVPAWPSMGDDPAVIVVAIATWLQMLVVALLPYTAGAMTIYNLLLKAVLEKLAEPLVPSEVIG